MLAGEILATLGILVLRRDDDGSFHLDGARPIWYLRLFADAEPTGGAVAVTERFPFLESFLPTAENFWASQASGVIRSGFWVESYSSGKEVPLKADAVVVEGTGFLLVEYVRSDFEHIKGVLQKARENILVGENADALKESLFQARARLSALLETTACEVYRVRSDGAVMERHPPGPRSDSPLTLDQVVDPDLAEKILMAGRKVMASGGTETLESPTTVRISSITSEEFWAVIG